MSQRINITYSIKIENLELELEALRKDTSMPKKEKASKLTQIMFKYKTREGDWDFTDYDMWDGIDIVIFTEAIKTVEKGIKKGRDKPAQKTIVSIFGNQNKRVNHQGGWIIDPVSVETYINNMTSTYFRQMSNIMSRMTLHKMENHLKSIDLTKIKEKTDETDLNGQVACAGGACEIV